MIENYARWVVRWRWLLIPLCVLAVLLAAVGGQRIRFQSDYRMFFGDDNPQLAAFEALQNTYTKNDNVLFVLAPREGEVFTPEVLAAVEAVTAKAWQVPFSIRVDSLTNFQHTHAEGDDLIVEDLVRDGADYGPEDLARVRRIALHEPLLVNRIVSPDGRVTGINVTIQLPGVDQTREVPEVAAYAYALAEEIRAAYPGIDVHLTGMSIMNNAFPAAAKHDMATLVPLMFAVVIVTLGLLLRAVGGTAVTVLVIALSIAGAMGLAGWLAIPLSPPAASAPTIILTLAVADCVHLLSTFYYNLRHGMARREAVVETLRVNFGPVFLTSLTTAIGFLSMNASDAPPFRALGNITAIGVTWAFLLSVTLLPALMAVLPVRVRPRPEGRLHPMEHLAEFVIRRRNALLWGAGVVIVVLIAFIPRNELNDEFVKYFDKSVDFRAATDFTAEHLTGIYYIDFSLASGEPGGVSEPAFLAKVEEFANWLREQPEVMHVYSITDIMKRLNRNLHGDDDAWYRLPEAREMAAQYLLLYEMSLPFGLDLNDRLNVDKSATRLSATLHNLSTQQVLSIQDRASRWLEENAPASMHTTGSSPTVMFAHIGARNIRSMLSGTTLALILISILLIFALRSTRVGAISIIPNLVPVAMAFGLWGLLVGEVGLALSVVGGMTLGIVVDDTIHFLSKYLRARREKGLDPEGAVRYAFSTVGTALWVTTVVLIAGFSVLAFSTFKVNAGMGMLTAIAIALALAADFLFLPPLLMRLEGTKK
ncbi:efflux RND transporter permease subunit [Endothiovibrio diazotrophicus]